MDEIELQQRIATWEDLHTEFKQWPVAPSDIAAAIVSFANTDGGRLILGVSNDRRVLGVDDTDRVAQTMDQVAYQNVRPPVAVLQETVSVANGATVLVVSVPKGTQRPYSTNKGLYYVRTGSGKRQASREELQRLFQASESLFYDEVAVSGASVADLEPSAISDLLARAYPEGAVPEGAPLERLLLNLRLARSLDGEVRPTVTAMLFLGREPQRFLPHAHVAAARIAGTDLASAPSDSKRIEGTMPQIIDDVARFLDIHLQTSHRIEGFAPESQRELPLTALREAIVNALAHRDYTIAAPVRVFVYDDRVEIRTPGDLPNTVTIEAMKLGAVHVLRNPSIYLLLDRLGMVTGIGSGVYRMVRLVREAVGREPDIYVQGNEVVVSLPRPVAQATDS
ncbi:MAG: RNA-binding domain-containing protein [Anaerolineae bacterium]